MNGIDIPFLDQLPVKFQGPVLLAIFLLPYATRAYHAVSQGGGLRGIWNAIWFGTNTPKPAAEQPGQAPPPGKVLPFLLCLGLAVALPACVTHPNVPDVALMQAVAKNAAYVGTRLYLQNQPQKRPGFELARMSLRALIAAGQFSTDDLTKALQSLPIKELQGDTGSVIVGAAITLWDAYGRQLASLDKEKVFKSHVLPVAQSILAGFDLALGPAPPPLPR